MNDVKQYEKMIRSMFPIYGSYEKRFFLDLKCNIDEFVNNKENITYSDLEEQFGSPANIIQDYLGNVNVSYLRKQLSRTKYVRIICFLITLGIVVALAIWGVVNYVNYKIFLDNLPAIEETTIEYLN